MKSLRIAFFALVVCGLAAFAQDTGKGKDAGKQSAVKDNILKMEKEWREATVKGDASALQRFASDDYHVITAIDGQAHSKAEQMDRIKSGKAKYSEINVTNNDVQVISPDLAIFHGIADVKMNWDGKDQTGRYHVSRVWHKMRGEWKAVWFQTTKMP